MTTESDRKLRRANQILFRSLGLIWAGVWAGLMYCHFNPVETSDSNSFEHLVWWQAAIAIGFFILEVLVKETKDD